MKIENNKVTIIGKVCNNFEFSHEIYGERFYTAFVETVRYSGVSDTIPFMVSDQTVEIKDLTGLKVCINGQFRSYNKQTDTGHKLILSVFVREIQEVEELPFDEDENQIELEGYICKAPFYRITPLGREITDLILAVNRPYKKSDYIPCIFWRGNAQLASCLEVGTRISLIGRIQSREYQKKISDGEFETRTAYEVSVSQMSVLEEKEEKKNVCMDNIFNSEVKKGR